jgi:serine/threonine protein kinase
VYHAKWRGQDVAVKEFSLPVEPHNAGARAQAVFKQQLKQTIRNYVNEVELNCELAHPNVVRLLGYATQPRLLLVQELLRGQSLDKQLYVEGWKPSVAQILKVALDIACGMRYLHTTWEKPIIHRDLKSPNLMLVAAPPVPGESAGSDDLHCADGTPLMVKITDFGLSRDKAERGVSQSTTHGDSLLAQTAMMTVCGSTLWMAPEILLGNSRYAHASTCNVACRRSLLTGLCLCRAYSNHGNRAHIAAVPSAHTTRR